jgi:hypothetical protein
VLSGDGLAPETDGPGAAFAICELRRQLGLETRTVVDATAAPLLRALGADPLDVLDLAPGATDEARAYLRDRGVDGLLAVERPGRAADGNYYTMAGRQISDAVSALDELFLAAATLGIPTVAIGDGGNEVGMGAVREKVATAVPHGERIASVVPADTVVVAGVSTWGAYGVIAAASCIVGRNLLPTAAEEVARLDAVLVAGAVDGVTGRRTAMIDGFDLSVTLEVLEAARNTVNEALT